MENKIKRGRPSNEKVEVELDLNNLSNKQKKELLQLNNTKFTLMLRGETKKFRTSAHLTPGVKDTCLNAIYLDFKYSMDGMNVDKFGSKKMELFTFTIFGEKVTTTLNYEKITIVEIGTKLEVDFGKNNTEEIKIKLRNIKLNQKHYLLMLKFL